MDNTSAAGTRVHTRVSPRDAPRVDDPTTVERHPFAPTPPLRLQNYQSARPFGFVTFYKSKIVYVSWVAEDVWTAVFGVDTGFLIGIVNRGKFFLRKSSITEANF